MRSMRKVAGLSKRTVPPERQKERERCARTRARARKMEREGKGGQGGGESGERATTEHKPAPVIILTVTTRMHARNEARTGAPATHL